MLLPESAAPIAITRMDGNRKRTAARKSKPDISAGSRLESRMSGISFQISDCAETPSPHDLTSYPSSAKMSENEARIETSSSTMRSLPRESCIGYSSMRADKIGWTKYLLFPISFLFNLAHVRKGPVRLAERTSGDGKNRWILRFGFGEPIEEDSIEK